MDTDDLKPSKPKHAVLPRLEKISIDNIGKYIAELESTVSRA
jgi:hypothetical protein